MYCNGLQCMHIYNIRDLNKNKNSQLPFHSVNFTMNFHFWSPETISDCPQWFPLVDMTMPTRNFNHFILLCCWFPYSCQFYDVLLQLKVPSASNPNEMVQFRTVLLRRCQQEFEKDKTDQQDIQRRQKEIDECTTVIMD